MFGKNSCLTLILCLYLFVIFDNHSNQANEMVEMVVSADVCAAVRDKAKESFRILSVASTASSSS
jgi:hypothetical protein